MTPSSFTFVLSMQIPSGKNAVQITRTGRRYPGKRFQVWRDAALDVVRIYRGSYKHTFDGPVELVVDYVPGDRIRRDAPGLLDALCHLLEKSGLVLDDAQVKAVHWTEFPVHPKRPQCSVTISGMGGGRAMSHWCDVHKKYEAKREPNSSCGTCWRLWFLKNPELRVPSREDVLQPIKEVMQ